MQQYVVYLRYDVHRLAFQSEYSFDLHKSVGLVSYLRSRAFGARSVFHLLHFLYFSGRVRKIEKMQKM